jgi:16S rRNA (guanine1207-N2)-methyltransferase
MTKAAPRRPGSLTAKAPKSDRDHSGEVQHYFARQPEVRSQPTEITAQVRGLSLIFTTDRGVFSHGQVDAGSRMLAETMDLPEEGDILDWGCGWGLLGIVAALTWPRARVTMVDVNERACALARANAERNAASHVEVLCGDAKEILGDRRFDAVICNPPISAGRSVVLGMMENVARVLRPPGAFWMVSHTRKGAKRLRRDLEGLFDEADRVQMRGGYRVLKATVPLPEGGVSA